MASQGGILYHIHVHVLIYVSSTYYSACEMYSGSMLCGVQFVHEHVSVCACAMHVCVWGGRDDISEMGYG